MKKHTKQINLTEGSILKTLTALALPIMASSFLGTAYSITDMAWIGLLGSKAVAGVGAGGMFVWLSQGLSSLARMGGQVNVAQSCGQGNKKAAQLYARAALQMVFVFGVVFAAVCLMFADSLIGFFNLGDAETIAAAKIYMQITCGLILFSFINITLTGLYTAQGNSRVPLLANLIGLVTNMVLDPVLILGVGPFPRLEVIGAAVATVLAQAIVMLVMVIDALKASEENILKGVQLFSRCDAFYYKAVCRIGGPTAIQGTVYCMISMVLTRMTAIFGPAAIATQRVGGQIEAISWNTADGFGAALNAFCGQNYGAKKADRIQKGYRYSIWAVSLWGILIMLAFILFPEAISRMFFHEQEAIQTSIGYLRIIGLCEAFMCVELTTVGALSGLGMTKLSSILSVTLTGMRVPLAVLLSRTALGVEGIWWALSVSSIAKGIIFYIAFQMQTKKLLRGQGA